MNKVLIVLKWDLTILKLNFCEVERRLKTKLMNLGSISHLKKKELQGMNYKVLNYSNVLLQTSHAKRTSLHVNKGR